MNWTGGGLRRQTKTGNRSALNQKQKQYFAKARTKLGDPSTASPLRPSSWLEAHVNPTGTCEKLTRKIHHQKRLENHEALQPTARRSNSIKTHQSRHTPGSTQRDMDSLGGRNQKFPSTCSDSRYSLAADDLHDKQQPQHHPARLPRTAFSQRFTTSQQNQPAPPVIQAQPNPLRQVRAMNDKVMQLLKCRDWLEVGESYESRRIEPNLDRKRKLSLSSDGDQRVEYRQRVKSPHFQNDYVMTNAIEPGDERIDIKIGDVACISPISEVRREQPTRLASPGLGSLESSPVQSPKSNASDSHATANFVARKDVTGRLQFRRSMSAPDLDRDEPREHDDPPRIMDYEDQDNALHILDAYDAAFDAGGSGGYLSMNCTLGSVTSISRDNDTAEQDETPDIDPVDDKTLWYDFLSSTRTNIEDGRHEERPRYAATIAPQAKKTEENPREPNQRDQTDFVPAHQQTQGKQTQGTAELTSDVLHQATQNIQQITQYPTENEDTLAWKDFVFGDNTPSPGQSSLPHAKHLPEPLIDVRVNGHDISSSMDVNLPNTPRQSKPQDDSSLLDGEIQIETTIDVDDEHLSVSNPSSHGVSAKSDSTFSLDRPSSVANASVAPTVLYNKSRPAPPLTLSCSTPRPQPTSYKSSPDPLTAEYEDEIEDGAMTRSVLPRPPLLPRVMHRNDLRKPNIKPKPKPKPLLPMRRGK